MNKISIIHQNHSSLPGLKNRRAALSLISAALIFSTLTGCSLVNKTGEGQEQPNDKSSSGVSTTAIGAASGAAIGAGLGAIIGSTSGNAGEGVAIGAAAGAVTGAGIGYQLERQELALNDNRRSIETQDQLIARQDQELSRLRQGAGDLPQLGENIGHGRTSKTGSMRSAPMVDRQLVDRQLKVPDGSSAKWKGISNTYKGNPSAKPFGSGSSVAPASRIPTSGVQTSRVQAHSGNQQISRNSALSETKMKMARMESNTAKRMAREQERTASMKRTAAAITPEIRKPEAKKVALVPSTPPKELMAKETAPTKEIVAQDITPTAAKDARGSLSEKATDSLPPARVTKNDDSTMEASDEVSAVDSMDSATEVSAMAAHAPKASTLETLPNVEKTQVNKLSKEELKKHEGDCKQATSEAQRGLNATADADRLFYLRRAARLCPSEPTYHVELGKVYSEIGKTSDARSELRKAIEIDPSNQIARDELSIIENVGAKLE